MRRPLVLVLLLACALAGGCRPPAPVAGTPAAALAPAAPLRFEDVTEAAGLRFKHFTGADGRFLMPESVGCGGAFLDYDNDGRLDVLLVNSTSWADRKGPPAYPALYRNRGDGRFEDVTESAGLRVSTYGMGCAAADYDGDGDTDVFITALGSKRLFRNEGGRFRDVTAGSGLERSGPWDWHTSAAWADYDRDGDLDLFVCRYVLWTPKTDIPCTSGLGRRTYCGPNFYTGDRSLLYQNQGDGRFRDVSEATGIAASRGKSLGVLPLDENGDGWVDFLITNDTSPNHLFRNEGGRRFTEVAQEAGIAVDENGKPRAGMGVDVADVDNDGGMAFVIGNFAREGLSLYQRQDPLYSDLAGARGLLQPSFNHVTFGLAFLDADRDGWQDLFICNGHVNVVEENGGHITHSQIPRLFRNARGRFTDVTAEAGPPLARRYVGRGLARGDFDEDGRPDLLLCENSGPARLLRNATADTNHWLGIRLAGRGKNREAFGAEVRLKAGGTEQRRWVHSGGSYLSESDPRLLFGLGSAARVDEVRITWPSGATSTHPGLEVDRYHRIEEPAAGSPG